MSKLTLAECFKHYDTKPKNRRWSWSARSDDGTTVAVVLWSDLFLPRMAGYRNDEADPEAWRSLPGWNELAANLQHALDHTEGLVRVIIARAKDRTARPRTIAECFPRDDLVMRVVALDRATGRFELQLAGHD